MYEVFMINDDDIGVARNFTHHIKCIDYAEKHFEIEGINRLFNHIIQTCEQCIRNKTYTGQTKEAIIPQISSKPFQQIQMDIAHFTPYRSQKKFILGIVDHYSKTVIFVPLSSQTELFKANGCIDLDALKH